MTTLDKIKYLEDFARANPDYIVKDCARFGMVITKEFNLLDSFECRGRGPYWFHDGLTRNERWSDEEIEIIYNDARDHAKPDKAEAIRLIYSEINRITMNPFPLGTREEVAEMIYNNRHSMRKLLEKIGD